MHPGAFQAEGWTYQQLVMSADALGLEHSKVLDKIWQESTQRKLTRAEAWQQAHAYARALADAKGPIEPPWFRSGRDAIASTRATSYSRQLPEIHGGPGPEPADGSLGR